MPVQRHCSSSQHLRDPAHADGSGALAVGDPDRRIDDLFATEPRTVPAPAARMMLGTGARLIVGPFSASWLALRPLAQAPGWPAADPVRACRALPERGCRAERRPQFVVVLHRVPTLRYLERQRAGRAAALPLAPKP